MPALFRRAPHALVAALCVVAAACARPATVSAPLPAATVLSPASGAMPTLAQLRASKGTLPFPPATTDAERKKRATCAKRYGVPRCCVRDAACNPRCDRGHTRAAQLCVLGGNPGIKPSYLPCDPERPDMPCTPDRPPPPMPPPAGAIDCSRPPPVRACCQALTPGCQKCQDEAREEGRAYESACGRKGQ